ARDDDDVGRVLRQHAPTWVAQLPSLDTDRAAPPPVATTPARMLRELADALEVLTRERPLVLVLEGLHWSDASTIHLIAYVARRRETARLLLIGTFRPADAIVYDNPLRAVKQELHARGQCDELSLGPLSLEDVQAYVDGRFGAGPHDRWQRLASRVHQRT